MCYRVESSTITIVIILRLLSDLYKWLQESKLGSRLPYIPAPLP